MNLLPRLTQNNFTRLILAGIFKMLKLKKLSTNYDYASYKKSKDYNIRRIIVDIKKTSLRGYFSSMHNVLFDPVDVDFDNLVVSSKNILMIHGEKDRVFPFKRIKNLAEQKDIKFIPIPNSNHLPVFNAVDTLAEIIFIEIIMR